MINLRIIRRGRERHAFLEEDFKPGNKTIHSLIAEAIERERGL